MEIEQPLVPLTETLARTVMDCLRVADPGEEYQTRRGLNEKGQWVRLWWLCLQEAAFSDEISKEEKHDELLEDFNAKKTSKERVLALEYSARNPL
ncbi:hypothetical protein MMC27_007449 [Xylographa pallens]|nr:hypothetical protein [Xylographa pallens]